MSLNVYLIEVRPVDIYSANVTHNLGSMAAEAGIYEHLWEPEKLGITRARQLVKPLRRAIALMRKDPDRFKRHNPANGWGSYDYFVPWLEAYLAACQKSPKAQIKVSR